MTRTEPTKIDFDFLRAFATSQHFGLELSIEQWRAPRFKVHNLVKFHFHIDEIYLCTGLHPGLLKIKQSLSILSLQVSSSGLMWLYASLILLLIDLCRLSRLSIWVISVVTLLTLSLNVLMALVRF